MPFSSPRVSVSQISTLPLSFAEDVRAYAAAGLDGLGIWETKLVEGGDAEALELFEASGLASASAIPVHPSILPLPLLGGLDAAGWDGLYDIEIFSDNGIFGVAYLDSLWDVPAAVFLPRARAAFDRVWEAERVA